MKKLLALLVVMGMTCAAAFCAEPTTTTVAGTANQDIDIDAAGAVALFLKQPRADQNVQVVKVRRSGLIIILSVAGKVPTTTPTQSK